LVSTYSYQVSILLYQLIQIKKNYQHQIDIFSQKTEFSKGIAILYKKKTKFTEKPKKLDLGFFAVRISYRNQL
jgi:hypothetical protein